MLLRPAQSRRAQALGVQAVVHIAIESQNRLLGVFSGEFGGPDLITGHIQRRQRVAQVHQLGNLLGRLGAQHLDQLSRLRQELRQGVRHIAHRGFVIQ